MIEPALRTPLADVNKAVTEEYTKAFNLNAKIKYSAQLAQQAIYDMCMGFKEMRDSKLYKELGYKSFEEYCEKETGFERTKIYRYIRICENLPEEFVATWQQIGERKLYLLSVITEAERAEIVENTDLESATVRELEAQIKTLKEKAEAKQSYNEARLRENEDTIKTLNKTKAELQERIWRLENDIKELESKPAEVVQTVEVIPNGYVPAADVEAEKAKLESELANLREQLANSKEELANSREKLAEAESAEPEKVTVPDTDGVFKAYMTSAYTAFNELVKFVQEHSEYGPKVNALIDNVKKSLEAV